MIWCAFSPSQFSPPTYREVNSRSFPSSRHAASCLAKETGVVDVGVEEDERAVMAAVVAEEEEARREA